MPTRSPRHALPALLLTLAALLALAACGGDPSPTPLPTATPNTEAPTVSPTPTPTTSPPADGDSAPTPTTPPATPAPPAADDAASGERTAGQVDGVVFVVSDGSQATFSVGEVLAGVSVPNYEAVMRTTGLTGEVRLDGAPSLVTVDLHSMTSDEQFRDRYVQSRMFPDQPTASVAFGDLTPLPNGFADGDQVATEADGTLRINGMDVPLVFAIEARDDGDVVHVVGRSTFTWDQIGEPVPTARSVVSVEDEVRVEVLLALTPQAG